ncbi:MAG: isocitrate lyase/PEP mutase family protein [Vulcanimicrobiaceae bacterium]
MKSAGARLREMIAAPQILVMPGVFDGFSNRLVEATGFSAGFITGAGLAESRLGQPDVGIMGLEDNLAGVRALVGSTSLPLMADGDTGYGNAINAFFTVQAFERTGIDGVMLEDQAWPKRCGHMAGKELISAEEMVQKIRAAVDARRDPDFIIKARTDAAGPYGIDEAIRRANMYGDVGADLLFADAVLSRDDIAKFTRSVRKPVSINMGFGIRTRSTTPLLSPKDLEGLGVAAVIWPRMLTAAAILGMKRALEAGKESIVTGRAVDRPELLVDFEELNALMGFEDIKKMEQRYLTETQLAAKYGAR